MVYIKCTDVVAKVSDILDGEAGHLTRMRFYGHVMMCRNCRRYLAQFKRIKELAGKITPDDLPPDFDQVMNFVIREIDKPDG